MRVIYMYHSDDPENGAIGPGSLPNPQLAYKGSVPLSLTHRLHGEPPRNQPTISSELNSNTNRPIMMQTIVNTMELRNQDVTLPHDDDTQFWCKIFEMQNFRLKQHLIKVYL